MSRSPWRLRWAVWGQMARVWVGVWVGVSAGLAGWAGATPAVESPTVRFAPERDYGPFVFADDDGTVRGLSVDLLERLAPSAGLRLQTIPPAPLADQLALLRAGGADLVSSLRPTPERAEYLAFTRPYVTVPAIVVLPSRAVAQRAPDDGHAALLALAGRPVAVGAGYAVEGFARQRFAQVRWVPVPDDVQALRGVLDGRFDAAVVDAASAAFITQRHRMTGLESGGPIGFDYALSLAVPKARTDLVQRLDAAIAALPLQERTDIQQRWMGPLNGSALMQRSWHRMAWSALWLGLAVLLLGVVLWRRRAHRHAHPTPPAGP